MQELVKDGHANHVPLMQHILGLTLACVDTDFSVKVGHLSESVSVTVSQLESTRNLWGRGGLDRFLHQSDLFCEMVQRSTLLFVV